MTTLLATRAWLEPVSRGNRHFSVDGGRLRQSGPRPDARLLRQPALEGLTRSARTDSPRQVGRNSFRRLKEAATAAAACLERKGVAAKSLGDIASRGPTTIVAPESQFRTCPSYHDSIGYPRMSASCESSKMMHRLLHASGSHPIPPPDDPNSVGEYIYKQEVALKVMLALPKEWDFKTMTMRESKDLSKLKLYDLFAEPMSSNCKTDLKMKLPPLNQ
ncbi:anthocyanidin 5,3-O-glucosyltransferase-like [Dorcoceras hygrometricum]|uniref:Anthocyanidin 5,3-O-glucosyltransferase-like n=1 Tax=Dorcoceras hygrometricum TaxID=472368 RepID=A0A2Z7DES3_9LAMI|nr:anthocyanidin 5,3-O-glucosyltransferase-like [Dorcoceras hygrometricum]